MRPRGGQSDGIADLSMMHVKRGRTELHLQKQGEKVIYLRPAIESGGDRAVFDPCAWSREEAPRLKRERRKKKTGVNRKQTSTSRMNSAILGESGAESKE